MASNKSLTFDLFGRDRTASKALGDVARSGEGMSRALKAGAFAAGAVLATVGVAAVAFSVDSIKAFAAAETAQNRLNFAVEKFPTLAGANADELRKLNTELQAHTRFEDDAIASAQVALSLYDLTAEQLKELTPLVLDYAAATGDDLQTAAENIGKALLGQGRALKAVGIDFQDAGDPAANYAQLIEGLSAKVKGFAETDAKSLSGQLEQINNQFGDVQEKVGSAFAPAIGVASGVIQQTLIPRLDEMVDRLGPKLQSAFSDLAPKLSQAVDQALPHVERLIEGATSGAIDLVDAFNEDLSPTGIFGAFGPNGQFARMNQIISESADANAELGFDMKRSWEAWGEWWDLAWDGHADTVQNKSWYIKETWRTTVAAMKDQLIADDMYQAGYDWVKGAALGIGDASYLAEVQAENMALRVIEKTTNTWQVKSPSKVAEILGGQWDAGIGKGILGGGQAEAAAARIAASVIGASDMSGSAFSRTGRAVAGGTVINVRGAVLARPREIAKLQRDSTRTARRQGFSVRDTYV